MKLEKGNEIAIKESEIAISQSLPSELDLSEKPSDEKGLLISREEFIGPLPHPSILKGYGDIVPNAPERILTVFEEDSRHTREMQRMALAGEIRRDMRGQWLGFFTVFLNIGLTIASYIFTESVLLQSVLSLSSVIVVVKIIFSNKGKENKDEED